MSAYPCKLGSLYVIEFDGPDRAMYRRELDAYFPQPINIVGIVPPNSIVVFLESNGSNTAKIICLDKIGWIYLYKGMKLRECLNV